MLRWKNKTHPTHEYVCFIYYIVRPHFKIAELVENFSYTPSLYHIKTRGPKKYFLLCHYIYNVIEVKARAELLVFCRVFLFPLMVCRKADRRLKFLEIHCSTWLFTVIEAD